MTIIFFYVHTFARNGEKVRTGERESVWKLFNRKPAAVANGQKFVHFRQYLAVNMSVISMTACSHCVLNVFKKRKKERETEREGARDSTQK